MLIYTTPTSFNVLAHIHEYIYTVNSTALVVQLVSENIDDDRIKK